MADLAHIARVLVVEDEALILMDVEATLMDAGVGQVVAAASSEDAFAIIDAVPLDGAVLDLHLGRSGWSYDIAQRLKEKGVPFLFSSGTLDPAQGFERVPLVVKPFSSEQLVTALLDVTSPARTAAAAG